MAGDVREVGISILSETNAQTEVGPLVSLKILAIAMRSMVKLGC